MYPNTGTCSSQLSVLKKTLSELTPPPNEEYLSQLKLQKHEYEKLKKDYIQTRVKKGKDIQTVYDSDGIVMRALNLLQSTKHQELFPALIVLSGFRPIGLLTADISMAQRDKRPNGDFWITVSNWPKKGPDSAGRQFTRDKPVLCPSWLFLRGVKIVRDYYLNNERALTKRELSQRYGKSLIDNLRKVYPQLFKPTFTFFRRFYCRYAYHYFAHDGFPTVPSENSFYTYVLGHCVGGSDCITYANLALHGVGKLKLFQTGRAIVKVHTKAGPGKTKTDKRYKKRKHTELRERRV